MIRKIPERTKWKSKRQPAMARSSRRVAVKQVHIVSELRRRVVEGLWVPGARLPTRRELEAEFSASMHTVQKALDDLVRDGFVYACGSRGTFVAENPPHLHHYGLIFPRFPREGPFPRFLDRIGQ